MLKKLGISFLSALFAVLPATSPAIAQQPKTSAPPSAAPVISTEKALELAQQGHCKEAIPALKHTVASQAPADSRKQAGVAGVRCALAVDNRDAATDFIRLLTKQFPNDPDVLFIIVHAYSDLSSRTAQELARTNPKSLPAHKLNAEAFEMQGNWTEAEREYTQMIAEYPNEPSLHFLLGRVLLSKPGGDAATIDRAKQEFQKELEIDPKNAGAHYVLGELARRVENCDAAVQEFSQAAKIDSSFAEAYYGWGYCLVTLKKYEEAIPPLRTAERLEPGNPMVHYSLAIALNQTGQKEEAQKEFAIHRDLTNAKPAAPPQQSPQ
jgi:tetratricopeptide (TPR) repeat protein